MLSGSEHASIVLDTVPDSALIEMTDSKRERDLTLRKATCFLFTI